MAKVTKKNNTIMNFPKADINIPIFTDGSKRSVRLTIGLIKQMLPAVDIEVLEDGEVLGFARVNGRTDVAIILYAEDYYVVQLSGNENIYHYETLNTHKLNLYDLTFKSKEDAIRWKEAFEIVYQKAFQNHLYAGQ